MEIILASSSPFRKALLTNLRIPFCCQTPNIDETPHPNESAQQLVERLARLKAQALQKEGAFVIGSDQVALFAGKILGKPHTRENAIAQLSTFSGKTVDFYTGLALCFGKQCFSCVEHFAVRFRTLDRKTIETYVDLESPLQCAGSFKSEGLGILLFEALEGRDPNALIGLPLIALNELFARFGVDLLVDCLR